jgi:hypothetical protein
MPVVSIPPTSSRGPELALSVESAVSLLVESSSPSPSPALVDSVELFSFPVVVDGGCAVFGLVAGGPKGRARITAVAPRRRSKKRSE